jgi:hypothetical protein
MLSIFLAKEFEQTAQDSKKAIFLQYFCDNKDASAITRTKSVIPLSLSSED